jgi:hypothetical protein
LSKINLWLTIFGPLSAVETTIAMYLIA